MRVSRRPQHLRQRAPRPRVSTPAVFITSSRNGFGRVAEAVSLCGGGPGLGPSPGRPASLPTLTVKARGGRKADR